MASQQRRLGPKAEAKRWARLRELIDQGATLEINSGGYHLKIASLYQEEQQVCMLRCTRMKFDAIMDHLEELAHRYVEDGMVTDEVNGGEYSVHE